MSDDDRADQGLEANVADGGEATQREKEFDLSGGRLCLDFVNTEGGRHLPTPRDDLKTYEDFVAFARQSGALGDEESTVLRQAARERPDEALSALSHARRLREASYRVFSARAAHGGADERDLAALNREWAGLLGSSRLEQRDGAFVWAWAGPADALDRPLWVVARSLMDLLASPDLATVKECASPTCTWLFVDTSRNHSRRWCDMKSCGNREKARRHYDRHRGE